MCFIKMQERCKLKIIEMDENVTFNLNIDKIKKNILLKPDSKKKKTANNKNDTEMMIK